MPTRRLPTRRILAAALAAATATSVLIAGAAPAQAASCPRGRVALTFDDGPTRFTPQILQVLHDKDVPAVFFWPGSRVDANPHLVAYAVHEGHQVLNHTNRHERLTSLSYSGVRSTLTRGQTALRRAGVPRDEVKLVRPPYGALDRTARRAISSLGYRPVLWDVDTRDWDPNRSSSAIRSSARNGLRNGAVILFHDGPMDTSAGANTVTALPGIIADARSRGYCFGQLDARGEVVAASRRSSVDLPPRLTAPVPGLKPTMGTPRQPDLAVRLTGDWDGDGIDTPGWFDRGRWRLRVKPGSGGIQKSFTFGRAGDTPVVGDWDGDGVDTVGVVRGNRWLLNDGLDRRGERSFRFGQATDLPVVGDWDGDGVDTYGVRRGNRWFTGNRFARIRADRSFRYGRSQPLDLPVVGDWDGDGVDEPGVHRRTDNGSRFYLRGVVATRPGRTTAFAWGNRRRAHPAAGDWDRDGVDTVGVEQRSQWALRGANTRTRPSRGNRYWDVPR